MEKWRGKIAVITGASAGIGQAVLKELAMEGVNVVGLARRVERVQVKTGVKGELGSVQKQFTVGLKLKILLGLSYEASNE